MTRQLLHASCVAFGARAVLILGVSGSGKSSLALELMAMGAQLVSDDRVELSKQGEAVVATAPEALAGKIEARFVGILNAEPGPPSVVELVIDLDETESCRLPPQRSKKLLGKTIPLLHNSDNRHFPAAILQYLKGGRSD